MDKIGIGTLWEYSFPNSVAFNPSGTAAAFDLTVPDEGSNDYRHELWYAENGALHRAFAFAPEGKYVWQDDENVLFAVNPWRDYSEIYSANIHTGAVRREASYRLNIKTLAWLGRGKLMSICRTDANYPDLWQAGDEEAERMQRERAEEEENYCVIEEIPYCKNGLFECLNKVRNTLFILDLDGSCKRVTAPLFQTERFCVDGDTIYFNGSAYDRKMCLFQELWSYKLGDEEPRCLYNGGEYNMRFLAMLDDKLILIGNTNPNIKLFHSEFYEVDKTTGRIRPFCRYDKSAVSYVTLDCAYGGSRAAQCDGGKLYFLSTIRNDTHLMALDKNGAVRPVIAHPGAICDFDVRGGKVFFTAMWDIRPLECYEGTVGGRIRRVSGFHDRLMEERYVAVPRRHTFRFEDTEIDGWALLPEDYRPEGRYPAILDIHGGPNACYSEVYYHEMQVWAGKGYIVLFCNPVGSEGRGDEFMNIHGDFGGEDYRCVMALVDEMLALYPAIDRKRLCVTGGSYGGFMTNWIVTHTDRFAAAATQRSVANWYTTLLLCDNGWYNMPPQLKADAYRSADELWRQSPMKYIDNVTTPLLILHSEQDYSVPIEEAMQLYSALVVKGVETRLVRFKGETHELSRSGRPRHRIRRLEEITNWMDKHTVQEDGGKDEEL